MKSQRARETKNRLIRYVLFPTLIGIISGLLIFIFKICTISIMKCSERIYGFVRENPAYLPLLIIGAVLVGGIAALILKYAKECRGGGITTAIAAIRGLIPLKWIQGIFALFTSSLLTYLAGIPLGNEGPSVQMGAAVGEGSAHLSGKKKLALERYLMTGGASSGFAIATGAPFTGIIFAIEEAHRRISAPLLMVASISVISGTVTHRYLSFFSGVNTTFFDLSITKNLPARFLWVAIIIGAVCGMSSYLFTKLYRVINKLSKAHGGKIPFSAKIMVIFAFTAVFGFFSVNFIGTGHSLIENILHARPIWYVIILAFVIRALLMICANNEGVSGGMFVPNLAFGAMIASLIMELFISIGAIDEEYYTILVIVGMASFLVASSRAPITSIAFAAEALCVASNILPVIMGVITSYIIAEFSDKKSFTETVIESRAESAHEGKDPVIVYSHMTVGKHSFADGMEIRDIIWPPTCAVLSIDRKQSQSIHDGTQEIREGDELHLHYQTYDPEKTLAALISILGEQPENQRIRSHPGSTDHLVPLE